MRLLFATIIRQLHLQKCAQGPGFIGRLGYMSDKPEK
jgi:hypothetical protein